MPMTSSDENLKHLVFLEHHRGTLPDAVSEADLEVLNPALDLLFSRLREARRQFTHDGDCGRLGAFTALGALWQFVVLFERAHARLIEVFADFLHHSAGFQRVKKPERHGLR